MIPVSGNTDTALGPGSPKKEKPGNLSIAGLGLLFETEGGDLLAAYRFGSRPVSKKHIGVALEGNCIFKHKKAVELIPVKR
jgi:hypothetical protein